MEYEILVEKDSNGRVIVDFYGLDFDITDEFVNGECHKVIFGDPIVFVLKGAEAKGESVENSNTAEEPEKHEEPEHSEEAIEHPPIESSGPEATDNHVGTSEEAHTDEKPVENPEEPVVAPEEEHTPVEPGAETEEDPKDN